MCGKDTMKCLHNLTSNRNKKEIIYIANENHHAEN